MLSLTRKADYALVGLADLARRAPEKASARQLAESSHVPLPMLMNILKELVAGGMVISTRGINGGYRLAKDPGEITLRELIQTIEGPINLTICCAGSSELERGAEVPTRNQAHGEVDVAVVIDSEVVDGNDPGVIELSRDPGFSDEPGNEACPDRRAGVALEQDLHGEQAIEVTVPHFEDGSHSATGDLASHGIACSGRSGDGLVRVEIGKQ